LRTAKLQAVRVPGTSISGISSSLIVSPVGGTWIYEIYENPNVP
jgi:hypothetical protein